MAKVTCVPQDTVKLGHDPNQWRAAPRRWLQSTWHAEVLYIKGIEPRKMVSKSTQTGFISPCSRKFCMKHGFEIATRQRPPQRCTPIHKASNSVGISSSKTQPRTLCRRLLCQLLLYKNAALAQSPAHHSTRAELHTSAAIGRNGTVQQTSWSKLEMSYGESWCPTYYFLVRGIKCGTTS